MGQLRDSFTGPAIEQHHPCLTNAVFLWACYISRPGPLSAHESHYLNRSLEGLSEALQHNDRVLDVIQASCLLSVYFLSNGRVLEGSYHAAAAASLTLQCGLHGAIMNHSVFESTGVMTPSKLEPAKDAIQQGERVLTFWQVFVLDRCWSAVLQKPVTIPDGPEQCMSIAMPWPQGMEEYESVSRFWVILISIIDDDTYSGPNKRFPFLFDHPDLLRWSNFESWGWLLAAGPESKGIRSLSSRSSLGIELGSA